MGRIEAEVEDTTCGESRMHGLERAVDPLRLLHDSQASSIFAGLGSCQNRGLARITRMTRILGVLFTVGFGQEGGGMDITV